MLFQEAAIKTIPWWFFYSRKGQLEFAGQCCDSVRCSSPGMHTSPWGSLWTGILMSCLALRWEKTHLSFFIVIFFGFTVCWVFEYCGHQIYCWVGKHWNRLHREFLSWRKYPKSWSWAASSDTTLSRLGWVVSRGPFQPELWFCDKVTQFWINSAWQLVFCWHRY